ncbi:MAG: hypothetical protein LBI06_00700 [Treponema sp.]|jgi:hypothetical protein|nr:hypothetical protein [Treponema sp.]
MYKTKITCLTLLIALGNFAACSLLICCYYGQLGGADVTDDYRAGDEIFEERMEFLSGIWYSHYAGIGRLDGYRIRKWSDMTDADKAKAQSFFLDINVDNLITYSAKDAPQDGDYIVLYDDTVYGQDDDASASTDGNWGFAYMGLVRAINIFNGNKDRGAIIIEYFERADPNWLWDRDGYAWQELERGEKPFFGIYYRVLQPDIVQMANAVDLAALYNGKHYYTEKRTLDEAIAFNSVENEAELISWGVVIPQDRAR